MKNIYQIRLLIAVLFLGGTFFVSSTLAATSRNDGVLRPPVDIYPNIKGNVESVGSPFLGAPVETGSSIEVTPTLTAPVVTNQVAQEANRTNPWLVRLVLFGLVIIGSIFILWKFRK